jgi:hypothetical protein
LFRKFTDLNCNLHSKQALALGILHDCCQRQIKGVLNGVVVDFSLWKIGYHKRATKAY